jgi:DNA-binding MarR family transcriptional regulator
MTYAEGLTKKQREVLSFLVKNREKPFSETALARALGVHKATMNHHLRRLESMGTVERRTDPADGRRLVIVAAPGVELLLG